MTFPPWKQPANATPAIGESRSGYARHQAWGNFRSQSCVDWFTMHDAQKYRDQAARLREEACASSDPEEVEMLNDVATMFERLAALLAEAGTGNGTSRH
jgi:hypothetical protein